MQGPTRPKHKRKEGIVRKKYTPALMLHCDGTGLMTMDGDGCSE